MASAVATHWWALAVRGILAVLFAALTFFIPGITLTVLVIIFGGYALADGIMAIVSTVRAVRGHRPWGAFLVEGIVGIAAGLFTFFLPRLTLVFLIFVIAAWAVVTGVLEIVAAIRLRKHIANEWLLIVTGVVSVIFGVALYAAPLAGAVVLAWWIGVYALVFGILMLMLAFRVRTHRRSISATALPA